MDSDNKTGKIKLKISYRTIIVFFLIAIIYVYVVHKIGAKSVMHDYTKFDTTNISGKITDIGRGGWGVFQNTREEKQIFILPT